LENSGEGGIGAAVTQGDEKGGEAGFSGSKRKRGTLELTAVKEKLYREEK